MKHLCSFFSSDRLTLKFRGGKQQDRSFTQLTHSFFASDTECQSPAGVYRVVRHVRRSYPEFAQNGSLATGQVLVLRAESVNKRLISDRLTLKLRGGKQQDRSFTQLTHSFFLHWILSVKAQRAYPGSSVTYAGHILSSSRIVAWPSARSWYCVMHPLRRGSRVNSLTHALGYF
ncbi:hypothetical protein CEXT_249861 [Caerostris extrusa]|uniref:Uncharacterized protein n=1 Tax=Caerostris extrusa TaxID=172846 RepID=A0AAV4W843_CAEEX|nr:hypothetical protein CEXT_249861 [Caerostris extrusa]